MNCAFCGEHFTGRKRKYCNKAHCLRAHGANPDYKPETDCLVCGKPLFKGQKKHCSGACNAKAYHRRKGGISMEEWRIKLKARPSRGEKEKQQRDSLSDRIVKGTIYIGLNKRLKGSIKYSDITPEMVIEKRAQILAWRESRANPLLKPEKVKEYRTCIICDNVFEVKGKSPFCGANCRNTDHRNKYYTNQDVILASARKKWWQGREKTKPFECRECGKVVVPEYETGNSRRAGYCSDECMKRNVHRNAKHKRRIRLAGAFIEPVYKARIIKRDKGMCQICGKKVAIKQKAPHPYSASLDHIIPLAKGGKHEPKNVRLVHFICNSIKSDGVSDGGDQLLLFG